MLEPRATETQRVFDTLKSQILQQQLPAGTPLGHSQLCRDLKTSRTPVREAIRKLEGIGLVNTLPHRGSFVAQLGLKDFLEINQIRSLLEPFAARQAAGQIPDLIVDELEQRLRAIHRERPGDDDFQMLYVIDGDIHRAIGTYAGNARLDDLSETLRSLCQQFSYDSRVRFDIMIEELLRLLDALRRGDADQAEAVMRQHVNNFGEALPRLISR